jgi:tyramine---L-glutamate ligase
LRLLICEYVTGGGFLGRPLPASLAREGDMMLAALVKDVAAIGDVDIASVRDERLGVPDLPVAFRMLGATDDPWRAWREAIEAADAVWPIAPETGGALARLSELVLSVGRRLIGSRPDGVALAASKRAAATHLAARGIAVVPTMPAEAMLRDDLSRESDVATHPYCHPRESGGPGEPLRRLPWTPAFAGVTSSNVASSIRPRPDPTPPGWVAKPDDGAGAESTRLFHNEEEMRQWLAAAPERGGFVVQPYVEGVVASLSMLCQDGRAWLLSCNRQEIAIEQGAFRFLGSIVGGLEERRARYEPLAAAIAAAMPELWGHVGIDLVDGDSGPLVLDINPRLTTSYVGLRRAIGVNPAGLVLDLIERDLGAIVRPLRVGAERVDVTAFHG